MSDHTRRLIDRVDTEIDAAAERVAAALYIQLREDAERMAAECRPSNVTDHEWNEVFLPAFLWKFHTHVMVKVAEGGLDWREVYFESTRHRVGEAQRRQAG
ncbi:MAG TPA: hypothetical protein VE644_08670 [Gaiellaceae bacterium]|nr:hypothetical protein [Gaiellaceae bacterium]